MATSVYFCLFSGLSRARTVPTLNNVTPAEILIAVILPCLTNRQTVAAEHPKTSLTKGNRAPASSGRAKNCVAWFVVM